VILWYVSGNRDEAEFENPDVFDVGRNPNRHLSFGRGG
jgi:cytochrome P450